MKNIKELIEDIRSYKYMPEKPYIYSKTMWINLLAIAALILQAKYGFIISVEEQIAVLSCINLILRLLTKKQLV